MDAEDTLRPVSDVVCALGEGPTWDAEAGVAHWVDDTGGALPDGLAVDSAGDLWIAMWGEGEIRRFAPDGLPRDALTTGVPYNSS